MNAEQDHDDRLALGMAATLPAPEPTIDGPPRPVPSSHGVAEAAERERVFEALFQVPAERQSLGSYVVLGTLGRGAMGTVLEAFDRALDRRVAVKVLHRELSERHRARLIREAQALAKISHPNVVQVYEVGEGEDGQVFIAMELVRGRSLADWQQQAPRPGWREHVRVYLQAGEGLAAAHAEGLVHRDFKPDNAVIDDKGRVRVLDFGLARQSEDTEDSELDARTPMGLELYVGDSGLECSLTHTGTVLGTPAYMPLEQMAGQSTDARSDQFSFCVSLYEALHGERPFEGRTMEALLVSLRAGQVRPAPKGSTVPEVLRRAVLRGLAKDPSERWPSMEALLTELRRLVAPRRRAFWALGVAGGLAALGVGLWQYAEVGFRCGGAKAQLDGIWDDARRQQVEDAILATGLSYAPDTSERVQAGLDEYALAWITKHTEVCEATSVRQEQSSEAMDLRMACLHDRRVELREAVGVLAQADATRVERAVQLVAGLPGLSRCDDVEGLRAELPPPEDPAAAEQVEALRERLVQVRTLQQAGAFDEAMTEAETVVEQAEALAYAPVLAEALLMRSTAHDNRAHFAEEERDAERAYLLAAEHGHDEVEAQAAVRLVWVVGQRQARYEAGLQWGRMALALAKNRRLDPLLEADALGKLGGVFRSQGRLPEALTHMQRALAIREQALGVGHPGVANALDGVGGVLLAQGKLEEALDYYRHALAIHEQTLGPGHPSVATEHNNIGAVLVNLGQPEEALTHLQSALAIKEQALGPRHPDVADSLNNLGIVLLGQRKRDQALTQFQRALAIREGVLGPYHPDVATALNNLGNTLLDQGESEAALTHHRRALAIREQALEPRHLDVAYSLANIGNALRNQGRLEEALTHYRRALAIWEQALGPRHPDVALSFYNIGNVLRRQGKLDEALDQHERGLAIREQVLGPRHPDVVRSLAALTKIALEQEDHATAREYAERLVMLRESSVAPSASLAEARFALARALETDATERIRARALAEQARDAYVESGESEEQDERVRVQAWLAAHPGP